MSYLKVAMRLLYFTFLSFLLLVPSSFVRGKDERSNKQTTTLTVAAAADLRFVMPELVEIFQKKNPGIKISVIYGASGKFYEQIIRGAPFDLFLSADKEYPSLLFSKGYSLGEPFKYAEGKLVLWMRKGLFTEEKRAQWKELLLEDKVLKIALANPERAPYGKAAKSALVKAHLWDRLKEKFVFGENVIQAFQFAEEKNAEVAFIPLSLALSFKAKNEGEFVEVPQSFYSKIEQYGIILKKTLNPIIAQKFKDFLLSEESRVELKKYGLYP
ncbi:molybdate ABC transporter substrate-binding protein [Candidatus Methylacidiphilum infernorum]|uniref:Molybdate ABC transporter substrate-binding protein n=2 Tax=Candidatus Methylacidiphilum infernorum TaxID=511746 RepID=A0ABX7PVF4_9BACT|nr:molybdate ABC transporter substrate-binding protein [Candidatus Methylacidiphilum infernorum]